MTENQKSLVWLCSLPKFGAIKIRKLVEKFNEPFDVWQASMEELVRLSFLSRQDLMTLAEPKYRENVKKHMDNLYRHDISMVSLFDEEYPPLLKSIYDPPALLFYKGRLPREEKSVAVVGSRRATRYGTDMAEVISRGLAERGFTVVSGLARGIDSFAHQAVVKSGGRTVAVLGCGLDIAYPKENQLLFDRIQEKGAVVSEYLPGTPPMAPNFPARNRIISGLSLGVIVIEAGEKSGSLITADLALEQGREVFAVPGNISSHNSLGTNRLIREGAKIITGMQDILDEIHYFEDAGRLQAIQFLVENRISGKVLNSLDSHEKKIVQCLSEGDLHVDELLSKADMDVSGLNASLITLELNGIVEQKPGRVYTLSKF